VTVILDMYTASKNIGHSLNTCAITIRQMSIRKQNILPKLCI